MLDLCYNGDSKRICDGSDEWSYLYFATSTKGVVLLKTTEKTVIVAITDNGELKRHIYPIATADGELMTHRLRRLLDGKIGHCINDYYEEWHDIRFVGLVWQKPYRLLEEIAQDRQRLQKELHALDSWWAVMPVEIPEDATNGQISVMIRDELDDRKLYKSQIEEIKKARENSLEHTAPAWIW